jgi:hypothetical protein
MGRKKIANLKIKLFLESIGTQTIQEMQKNNNLYIADNKENVNCMFYFICVLLNLITS